MRFEKIIKQPKAFFEGPAAASNGQLYFSNYRGAEICTPDGNLAEAVFEFQNNAAANGLMWSKDGVLWGCDMKGGKLVTIDLKTNSSTARACRFSDGKKFDRPNDLVIDDHGGVYFTCPGIPGFHWPGETERGVYYLHPNSKIIELSRALGKKDIQKPNGIAISKCGEILYVAQHKRPRVMSYRITEQPGVLEKGKTFCTLYNGRYKYKGGDGLTIDTDGRLYVATSKGVEVFSEKGMFEKRLLLPKCDEKKAKVANITFGGKDHDILYATAYHKLYRWSALYSMQMDAKGLPLRGITSDRPSCAN
ncbi:MAG: SMP-30/gluconolactonase/LRE family protein [Pirellulales bacterium]